MVSVRRSLEMIRLKLQLSSFHSRDNSIETGILEIDGNPINGMSHSTVGLILVENHQSGQCGSPQIRNELLKLRRLSACRFHTNLWSFYDSNSGYHFSFPEADLLDASELSDRKQDQQEILWNQYSYRILQP